MCGSIRPLLKLQKKTLTLLSVVAPAGVLEEAEFYNIASLVRLVKERIRDNENRTSQVCKNEARLTGAFVSLFPGRSAEKVD